MQAARVCSDGLFNAVAALLVAGIILAVQTNAPAQPAEPGSVTRIMPVRSDSTHPVRIAGRIRHSLYQAARRAGLNRRMRASLVAMFARRVDYRHDIQAGDRFVVIYRKDRRRNALVAAELDTNGEALQAFRYSSGDGDKPVWYSDRGKPIRPTLLRTPVDYTRVSSPFSHRRLNPVLHIYRPHYGVDLAAPAGTPVRAAGSGKVTFRGPDGGYGNLVIIDNVGPYSTRYGHMKGFAKGIRVGSHVHQGEVIGYVGQTGLATGPHLHFEIRVNGKPRPPLKVELPREALHGAKLAAYEKAIVPLTDALDPTPRRSETAQVASADPDKTDAGEADRQCRRRVDAQAPCPSRQGVAATIVGQALPGDGADRVIPAVPELSINGF